MTCAVRRYCELVSILCIHVSNVRQKNFYGRGVQTASSETATGGTTGDTGEDPSRFISESKKQAIAMVDMLHNRWAAIAAESKVMILRSMTDNFIAVANVTEDQGDQMSRIARLSMAACRVARELLAEKGMTMILKAGIHCGSVMAKLHGEETVELSVFGDSLTMASNFAASSVNTSQTYKVHLSEVRIAAFSLGTLVSIKVLTRNFKVLTRNLTFCSFAESGPAAPEGDEGIAYRYAGLDAGLGRHASVARGERAAKVKVPHAWTSLL